MSVTLAPPSSGRFTPAGVLAVTAVVFAAVVGFVTLQLRSGLREQILLRIGEMFSAVASFQLDNSAALPPGVTEVPGRVFIAVLNTSRLKDVVAVRVFDAERKLFGANGANELAWSEEPPAADAWKTVAGGRSVARLHPRESLAQLMGLLPDELPGRPEIPLLEIWVPLRKTGDAKLEGAAQFWIDGGDVRNEFAGVDRKLALQAAIAWLTGTVVIFVVVGWAFRRLAVTNRELQVRSDDLQRANSELMLAAKTSALGAVSAHLIHELKSPLAGLEIFVANQAGTGVHAEDGRELAAASELTKRLRNMINDVVGVLRDEQGGANFDLTCAELADVTVAKVRSEASRAGVALDVHAGAEKTLSGRTANLGGLVLRNLLQNAVEATPKGGVVSLTGRIATDGAVEFLVEDRGLGLPESIRTRLFQPCTSTKPGGSGLGLALSFQLAQQAGGRLELVRSDPLGTCFRLVLKAEA